MSCVGPLVVRILSKMLRTILASFLAAWCHLLLTTLSILSAHLANNQHSQSWIFRSQLWSTSMVLITSQNIMQLILLQQSDLTALICVKLIRSILFPSITSLLVYELISLLVQELLCFNLTSSTMHFCEIDTRFLVY